MPSATQALDAGASDPRRSAGHEREAAAEAHGATSNERRDARMPPSTSRAAPFTNAASGETRKATAPATSAACPIRPTGGRSQPSVVAVGLEVARARRAHAGLDVARADGVRAHPARAALDGEHLREHDGAPLRDRIRADRRLAPHARVRGDQRDRAQSGTLEQRQGTDGIVERGHHVRLDERVPLLVAGLEQRRIDDRAVVDHEGVEAAERLGRASGSTNRRPQGRARPPARTRARAARRPLRRVPRRGR